MKWSYAIDVMVKKHPEFLNTQCDDSDIIQRVLDRMTQHELQSMINDEDDDVRLKVARLVNSQDCLWSMRNDRYPRVREVVAERIEDQDRLWEMRNDRVWNVRGWVADRIEDQDRLWEMRATEKDNDVIAAIDTRLQELELTIKEDTV